MLHCQYIFLPNMHALIVFSYPCVCADSIDPGTGKPAVNNKRLSTPPSFKHTQYIASDIYQQIGLLDLYLNRLSFLKKHNKAGSTEDANTEW